MGEEIQSCTAKRHGFEWNLMCVMCYCSCESIHSLRIRLADKKKVSNPMLRLFMVTILSQNDPRVWCDMYDIILAVMPRLSYVEIKTIKKWIRKVDALHNDERCNNEWFAWAVEFLIKYPCSKLNIDDFVQKYYLKWCSTYDRDMNQNFASVADVVAKHRLKLSPNTRTFIFDDLKSKLDSGTFFHGVYKIGHRYNCMKELIAKLSPGAVAWARVYPKIRVIGRLRLMQIESAERVYAFGQPECERITKALKTEHAPHYDSI